MDYIQNLHGIKSKKFWVPQIFNSEGFTLYSAKDSLVQTCNLVNRKGKNSHHNESIE
jgi:hypothetical protein